MDDWIDSIDYLSAGYKIKYIKSVLEWFILKKDEIKKNKWKYYNPFYWGELKRIEFMIDIIERDILLYSDNISFINSLDMNKIIEWFKRT